MGFRALKEKKESKRKKLCVIIVLFFALASVALLVISYFIPPESWAYRLSLPDISKKKVGEMRVHFIDVGQGDSILVELPDGKTMLIDGGNGEEENQRKLMRYLNALDIDKIEHLVVTHTDGDHCGGLAEVFTYKKVVNAYMPLSFSSADTAYATVYEKAVKEKCTMTEPSRSVDLSVKTGTPYTLRFLYPYAQIEGSMDWSENDHSVVVWLDYMGTSALFSGDISSEVEEKLVTEASIGLLPQDVKLSDTEILKVGHHGSATSTSTKFLNYLGVETAVISCGENRYGHPSSEVLARLQSTGATTYRTDMQGHVMLTISPMGEYQVQTIRA